MYFDEKLCFLLFLTINFIFHLRFQDYKIYYCYKYILLLHLNWMIHFILFSFKKSNKKIKKMLKLNNRKSIINEQKTCYSLFTSFQEIKVLTNFLWLLWWKKASVDFKIGLEKYFGGRLMRNKRELMSAWKRARSFHMIPNPRTCRRNSLTWTILIFGTCHPVLSMIIWGVGLLTLIRHLALPMANNGPGSRTINFYTFILLIPGKLH